MPNEDTHWRSTESNAKEKRLGAEVTLHTSPWKQRQLEDAADLAPPANSPYT
jgi:hypothetical protein